MLPVIMVFAKAPIAGRVKTRLQPLVTPEAAAELYNSFVGDVLEAMLRFTGVAEIEIHLDEITEDWLEFPYRRVLQSDGNIGTRMLNAAHTALTAGHPLVLILGSDSPNLPLTHVQHLLDSEADVMLGPAEDGGFYGISMKQTHPKMFEEVEWSTELALEQTVVACERCGLKLGLGKPWYDIDSPADLVKLVTHLTPPRTTAWLIQHQFLIEK